MEKHLVHLAYDCDSGKPDGRWEVWGHKPEIGYQPGGRCYSWLSDSRCQDSKSGCYLEVMEVADFSVSGIENVNFPEEKIEALVAYNKDKGYVMDIGEVLRKGAGGFDVQFNPGRERRKGRLPGQVDDPDHAGCVLCAAIYSKVPEFIGWDDYCLFPNPYPIFRNHFTLISMEHEDSGQVLTAKRIKDGIDFFSKTRGVKMFFNGKGAGASSPDHFHFQGFSYPMPLPVERFHAKEIASNKSIKVSRLTDYPATVFVVESDDAEKLIDGVYRITSSLGGLSDGAGLTHNVLFSGCGPHPDVYIFPRDSGKQKSKHYKSKPATIEMSGMLVMSDQNDIERYGDADMGALKHLVEDVLEEVTVPGEELSFLADDLFWRCETISLFS